LPNRLALSLSACLLALIVTVLPVRAAEDFSAEQTKSIEAIVKDYLLAHPEVILQAVESMQKRDVAQAEAKVQGYLKAHSADLRHDANSYVGGNPDGDVTVVEYFDYRCGYCKKVHPVVAELLKSDKNLRLVYKEFPILGPQSKTAAVAAVAALRLDAGKYLGFHNALMSARGDLDTQAILDIAAESGLDPKALSKAMQDPEISGVLARNYRDAKALGINGTPGFIIGDAIVPGYINLAQMRDLISEARAGCKTC